MILKTIGIPNQLFLYFLRINGSPDEFGQGIVRRIEFFWVALDIVKKRDEDVVGIANDTDYLGP